MNLLAQLLVNGLVSGSLFALLAVGFGLVYRSLRVFHIAYAAILMIGSYSFYFSATSLRLPIPLSLLLGVVAATLGGWAIEIALYRPFFRRRASSGVVMVASLGLLVVTENFLALVFGDDTRVIPRPSATSIGIGPVVLTSMQVLQLLVAGLVLSVFFTSTRRVSFFRAIWAMGDQPELVPVLGLPLLGLRSAVLALSASLGALAACLVALDVGMSPHVGMSYLLIAAVAVLVGGVDSYAGWIVGAFVLAILQGILVWKLSAAWMDLATFSLLVAALLFRPRGLFGLRKRVEEDL